MSTPEYYRIENVFRNENNNVFGTLVRDSDGSFVLAARMDLLINTIMERGYNVTNIVDVERQLDRV